MAKPEDKTVLVVDDEEDIAAHLEALLEDAGFNVITAQDGEEALEMVKQHKPDFISLDLIMPKISGIKFYYELRRSREWSKIPVVVVTAHAKDETVRKDIDNTFAGKTISGPKVYLQKPVNPQDYVNLVKRELGVEVEETPHQEIADLQRRAQELIDGADPETLKTIIEQLKKKQ